MKKLKMHTPNLTEGNIEKIREIFPNVITEKEGENGTIEKSIDFDLLKQMLSDEIVEDDSERYRLDWPGKKASLLKANTPIASTLRPDRESSVNFDTTENLFIEGDNFEVLKILQESYLGKIKMIYIDPPYNTGKDFVYRDNRTVSKEDYEEELGVEDEEGGKLFRNTDTNGRFHSDWLSMMYERLLIARDLLKEDGVIFISIDDNEVHNLRKICDEVFGENNFIAQVIWERAYSPVNLKKYFSESHDYIICFAKNLDSINSLTLSRTDAANERYKNIDNDPRGDWKSSDFSVGPAVEGNIYEITTPSGRVVLPPSGRSWRVSKEKYREMLSENKVWFGENGDNVPSQKRFLSDVKDGITPITLWKYTEVGHSQDATKKLKELFDDKMYFEYPKPIGLIQRCLDLSTKSKDIILDFFSGSATTAHAVMQINTEDGGDRKFIMVQLPEKTDEGSEAHKAGYKNIAEIGKERIRRAGKKILEDNKESLEKREKPLDIGFRVYKTDTTNMKDVYYHPSTVGQKDLLGQIDNIKEDRNAEDLLTQVILDLGLTLDLPIEKKKIKSNDVYFVASNSLVACFDDKIDFSIIDDIANYKPLKVVFKDTSFKEEQDRTNLETRFKRLSPDTIITVL